MKRSAQEIIELVVFALIALIIGTGVVWLAGWLLGVVGTIFTWLASLVWSLLRFLVPLAIVIGGVYLLVRLLGNNADKVAREHTTSYTTPPSPWTMTSDPERSEATHASPGTQDGHATESSADATGDDAASGDEPKRD